MTLGVDTGESAVRWAVRDGDGVLVDSSSNSRPARFPTGWTPTAWPRDAGDATVFGAALGWRLAGRRLQLQELLKQGRGHPNDEPGYEVPYTVLVIVVGLVPAPVEATLSRLSITLVLLSVGVWCAAAVIGRRLCLRALAPVSRMAKAAKALTAADLGHQLPSPGTRDELDELGQAFNDLLERLHESFNRMSEAYEQQRRFAGDASHQLRTPLAALLGQVQVARRRDRSADEYRGVLEPVSTEGARLRQIVESLLFIAQPDDSWREHQSVDLTQWLPDHLRLWSAHPRATCITS
jgi:signal transduction histidine kinase